MIDSGYLGYKRADPDGDEDDVAVESLEDVPLTVDLTSVDLIKQRHHNERVEDDCEVLCWLGVKSALSAAVNVKQQLTCTPQHCSKNHDTL